ncbi:MAG: hydantoinase B/oxoprolinase family protein [Alphaproteobacteria bacterium]|jgi:N-methylhydantoinase B|nr:hydantoinase B/oxoprolinase family protein [Alphaproteobacteria bacterium]
MASTFDSLELEIAWSRIASIAEEADANVMRTAFSSIIRDSHDYSCAIYDARGNLLSQPNFVTPGHMGGMSAAMKTLTRHFAYEDLRDGDMIVTNDPWIMSGHLPDILVTAPVFHRSRLVAFAACVFHHQDIGGHLGIDNREVYEEGLQIPPCLLYRAGRENEELFRVIGQNVRVPDLVVNDLRSQVATVHFTGGRIRAFLEEMGLDGLEPLADEIYDRTEAALRRGIAEIPDGTYRSECLVEGGEGEAKIGLKLRLDVQDGAILADFSGTEPQVDKGINCVFNYTLAYCVFALKSIAAPFVPSNAGTMRPFTVAAPDGSILNARRPAAVVGRTSIGQYIPELVFRALATAVPERVIAESGSLPLWWLTLSGRRRDGRAFVIGPMFSGGLGARSSADGVSALTFPANIKNNPVEMIESDSPLLVERRELVPDSAGPGRHRGGFGQEFVLVVPEDETAPDGAVVNFLLAGRMQDGAKGLAGGGEGVAGSVTVNGRSIGWGKPHLLQPGDRVAYRTAGGGGYGDPREREPVLVARELRDGLISPGLAKSVYGREPGTEF